MAPVNGARGADARLVRERWSSTEVLMLTVYSDENKIFESIYDRLHGHSNPKPSARRCAAA